MDNEIYLDKGKVTIDNKDYQRIAIKTHLIEVGEDIKEIVRKYALPIYEVGDIVCISEKVLAICQKDIVYKKDIKVSLLAKILSKFVHKSKHGKGLRDVYNMQIAINLVGPFKILYASILSVLGKLIGRKGVFYTVLGHDVRGIDGCLETENNKRVFDCYFEFATLNPSNSSGACEEIKQAMDIDTMVVDANDLDCDILGSNHIVKDKMGLVKKILRDNPAGQFKEQTPLILIRPINI